MDRCSHREVMSTPHLHTIPADAGLGLAGQPALRMWIVSWLLRLQSLGEIPLLLVDEARVVRVFYRVLTIWSFRLRVLGVVFGVPTKFWDCLILGMLLLGFRVF